jgi:TetR/AcrR family transcriptional regulator, transcriptional repressor for nem operon
MRVNRKTMAEHRTAILRQAGRLFRQHGIDGVAVADITGAAGLTHGAFYGHFPSKTALAAESCRHSLEHSARIWRERAAAARSAGTDSLDALIDAYLTPVHRD